MKPKLTTTTTLFVNDTATTEIYTLSLHDALPIWRRIAPTTLLEHEHARERVHVIDRDRSEEHTSELQSQSNLVCRLLLEKKKNIQSLWLKVLCEYGLVIMRTLLTGGTLVGSTCDS